MEKTKPFNIPKLLFAQAYKLVAANNGVGGVDQQSLADFAKDLKGNLYKLWNRMSSGSYFPPAVKAVRIPKKTGGERTLGIPTVSDRVAQMVVRLTFEPEVEKVFLPDSYGYRPNKSALEAIGVTRQRCWRDDWVLEFDIKGLFDNISHELLMKAVGKHAQNRWETLYIKRWLTADMQNPEGTLTERTCGTPQGGVISPVLSNVFLHYTFDAWMRKNQPGSRWCRYADDGLVHCKTKQQAEVMLGELTRRFKECGLTLHPDKTKIVYCRDEKRKREYPNTKFDFLGYTYRARRSKNSKDNSIFANFTPAVSEAARKAMRATTREHKVRKQTELSLKEIAQKWNPILQGWINYYGEYNRKELDPVWRHFNKTLVSWAMRKYKLLHKRKTKASAYIRKTCEKQRNLFAHWRAGMQGVFV